MKIIEKFTQFKSTEQLKCNYKIFIPQLLICFKYFKGQFRRTFPVCGFYLRRHNLFFFFSGLEIFRSFLFIEDLGMMGDQEEDYCDQTTSKG